MFILQNDNEENAVICLRIIFDLHKNYRSSLEVQVQPFLSFVLTLYKNFQRTTEVNFSLPPQQSRDGRIAKSTESFKVVIESPIIVMFLLQSYQESAMPPIIPTLVPLMVHTIEIQPPPMAQERKSVLQEFIAAQVRSGLYLGHDSPLHL